MLNLSCIYDDAIVWCFIINERRTSESKQKKKITHNSKITQHCSRARKKTDFVPSFPLHRQKMLHGTCLHSLTRLPIPFQSFVEHHRCDDHWENAEWSDLWLVRIYDNRLTNFIENWKGRKKLNVNEIESVYFCIFALHSSVVLCCSRHLTRFSLLLMVQTIIVKNKRVRRG